MFAVTVFLGFGVGFTWVAGGWMVTVRPVAVGKLGGGAITRVLVICGFVAGLAVTTVGLAAMTAGLVV